MIDENRPSLIRIVQTDYLSFYAIFFPIILWVVYVYSTFIDGEVATSYTLITGAVTIGSIIVLFWRVMTLFTIFNEGQETIATINDISFYRGRGRVKYVHTFRGEKYLSSNLIKRTGRTKELAVGDQVTILVDVNNPKKAFIRDLYI